MITIIIVDYNSICKTIAYIREVIDNNEENIKINFVIVDNSNQDISVIGLPIEGEVEYQGRTGSRFLLNEYEIVYVRSGENMGYARGNNLGALLARDYFHSKYFVFSNNDLHFSKTIPWHIIIEHFKENENTCSVGFDVVDKNTGNHISPIIKADAWTELFLFYYRKLFGRFVRKLNFSAFEERIKKCDALAGCFVIVKAEDFFSVNGYDENTFLYFEELILGERFKTCNKDSVFLYLKDFHIIHDHGGTIKKNINTISNDIIMWKSKEYYWRNYRKSSLVMMLIAKVNFYLFYIPLMKLKIMIKCGAFK